MARQHGHPRDILFIYLEGVRKNNLFFFDVDMHRSNKNEGKKTTDVLQDKLCNYQLCCRAVCFFLLLQYTVVIPIVKAKLYNGWSAESPV